jgi:hypothetical protein
VPPLDILATSAPQFLAVFGHVHEGMEFLAATLTILGSLIIMVLLGAWWSR